MLSYNLLIRVQNFYKMLRSILLSHAFLDRQKISKNILEKATQLLSFFVFAFCGPKFKKDLISSPRPQLHTLRVFAYNFEFTEIMEFEVDSAVPMISLSKFFFFLQPLFLYLGLKTLAVQFTDSVIWLNYRMSNKNWEHLDVQKVVSVVPAVFSANRTAIISTNSPSFAKVF